jgi:hypothetical protein
MESIFLILSGVILVAGVLYWLWSHIQLTQKKVQLLENAVFELRGMLANSGGGASGGGPGVPVPPSSPTKQVQVAASSAGVAAMLEQQGGSVAVSRADDDEDDGWGDERKSTPLDDLDAPTLEMHEVVEDALQPGGRAMSFAAEETDTKVVGAPVVEEIVSETIDLDASAGAEQFRSLFVAQEKPASAAAPAASAVSRTPESLESMPVKDLRRLAEQRGIAGAADMRKKEILAALRQQVSVVAATSTAASDAAEGNSGADSDIKEIAVDTAEILE